jgi:uncharacterized protein
MQFSHQFEVDAPVDDVWTFLWQADKVGACLPGCKEVRTIRPFHQYEAVVEERVGPFRAHFDWAIDVQDQIPMSRIAIVARGKDTKLAATARAQMTVALEAVNHGSRLAIDSELQVTGKIASLGQVVLRRKSDEVVTQFAEALRRRLNGVESEASDA